MDAWATTVTRQLEPTLTALRDPYNLEDDVFYPASRATTIILDTPSGATTIIPDAPSRPPSLSLTGSRDSNDPVSPTSKHFLDFSLSHPRRQLSSISDKVQAHGWRAYAAILAGFLSQILCWGLIMTFGNILSFYSRHLMPSISKTKLSIIGGLPPFFLLFLALLWGRLLDAGHHRKLNALAGLCITAGFIGLAFTGGDGNYGDGKYFAILLASIPIGFGQSIYFLTAPHQAKTWFPNHKGLAMGFTNAGAAVGGSIFPICFTEVTRRQSFKGAIFALAGITLLLSSFIAYFSVPCPDHFRRRAVGDVKRLRTWFPTRAFRSHTMKLHIVAMCFIYLGILTIPFFIELWAGRLHLGVSEASRSGTGINDKEGMLQEYLVVILNTAQLPGRFFGSALCDRIQARKIHLTASVLTATLILTFWLRATSYVAACVFAGLFGLLLGVMVSLPINDAQDILTSKRTHLFGQYSGVVYTCASPFIFGGALVGGVLVDHVSLKAAGVWSAVVILVGAAAISASLLVEDDTWKFDEVQEKTGGNGGERGSNDDGEKKAIEAA